jgi:sRNA-binding protein
LRAEEAARQAAEAKARAERERQAAEAQARAEEEARQRDERTAKAARTRKVAKADPLAEIKDALAAGALTGPEAIDRAYRLGFEAGEQAARKAA